VDAGGKTPNGSLIDEIVRKGARRMLAAALEAEVNTYLAQLADERDEQGWRLVVRNGYHAEWSRHGLQHHFGIHAGCKRCGEGPPRGIGGGFGHDSATLSSPPGSLRRSPCSCLTADAITAT
jgi:hypothetical protein